MCGHLNLEMESPRSCSEYRGVFKHPTAAWATLVGGDSARSSDTSCLPVNNDDTYVCRKEVGHIIRDG